MICNGRVKLSIGSTNGKPIIVRVAEAGEIEDRSEVFELAGSSLPSYWSYRLLRYRVTIEEPR